MSRPAIVPQERYVAVSPAIRGLLLDLVLNEVRRLDGVRANCRRRRIERPMLDRRADDLRRLADELAR